MITLTLLLLLLHTHTHTELLLTDYQLKMYIFSMPLIIDCYKNKLREQMETDQQPRP